MNDPAALAQALIQQPMMAAVVVAVGLTCILKLVNEAMRLRASLAPKPEPREVQDEARAGAAGISERVTCMSGRVDRVGSQHETLVARVDHQENELVAMRERETNCAGRIHKRIDEIATIQAHTAGKVDEGFTHLKQSLAEIRLIVLTGKAVK